MQGVYWQGNVGETDWIAVHLPPRSWWDLDIDKPVIIRLKSNEWYEKRPDGSIYKIGAGWTLKPVTTVGDTIPGNVIYLLAKKGEKMVKVAVTTVRKGPEETKPSPTPPTATAPVPPATKPRASTGATPLPPARPISPKGGMV